FEYSDRAGSGVRVARGSAMRGNTYGRVIPMQPDDAAVPPEADFLYPQELEEVSEPAPRQRRPRGTRPMPKRLSEEFSEELVEEEIKATTSRRRSARASRETIAYEAPL